MFLRASVTILVMAGSLGLNAATAPVGLEHRALTAMGEGRHLDAQKLLQELAEAAPGNPRVLYNLACCASRLGEPRRAAEHLEAAWQAGFRDLQLMRTDPDLEALRSSKIGQRAIGRVEDLAAEERRRRGEPLVFDATVLASARVVTPERAAPGRPLPLVVALHGHGGDAEGMAGLFAAAGRSPDLIVVAPSGPYPVQLEQGFGLSWYPQLALFNEILRSSAPDSRRQAREELEAREEESAERVVLGAIDAVSREQSIDEEAVFLLGFSEGAALAYGLALAHPERFRGLVVVGGRLRQQDSDPERLAGAAGKLEVLVCHSPDDEAIHIDEGKRAVRLLSDAGITTRLLRYPGGHGFTAGLVDQIVAWIEQRVEHRVAQ